MLTIARLGRGGRAADYYVDRQAGCDLDYYTGEGERRGRWLGSGATRLGLTGTLTPAGEGVLRGLLDGRGPDGVELVPPVLRADPRGRLRAAPLVKAVNAAAVERGVEPAELVADERLAEVFAGAVAAVAVDARLPRRPRASLPASAAVAAAAAAGVDPVELYRDPEGGDAVAAALHFADERIDVRRAGLDLTFSAPKSVSVLFGLGDEAVAGQVRAAHAEAIRQTVGYLESLCARAARGHQGPDAGQQHRIGTDGWLAVAFEHRASRADDPQLHTHVVVANVVRGQDGRWSAFDTREAYRQAQTGGYVYQAVLRGELTRRLGVGWGPVRRGVAEVDGVPAGLRRLFSRRRQAIEEHLAEHDLTGPRAAQVAALATRASKGHVSEHALRQFWADRAAEGGVDPIELIDDTVRRIIEPPDVDETVVAGRVLGERGVTARTSSFDRRELLRAVCEAVPAGAALTVDRLRSLATSAVRDRRVVPLITPSEPGLRRYSTAALLRTEACALAVAVGRDGEGLARLDMDVVHTRLAGSGLSAEQAAMVVRLTCSGAGVEVVVGPAGAGKTAALAVARAAWADAGVCVRGTALAAIAARTLEDGAGIPSRSLTRLFGSMSRSRRSDVDSGLPPSGGVLVVDEAGMVGTRQLARLIDLTRAAQVKLVLVGDPAQLPEIDAGGLFAALSAALPSVQLSGNVRQREPWERQALTALRSGDVLDALAGYKTNGRLHTAGTAAQAREDIVGDYLRARAADPAGDVLMLAGRRAEARALNNLARTRLLADGILDKQALTVTSRGRRLELRVGDEVVVTANDYPAGLINGTRGRVSTVTCDGVQLVTDAGPLTVPLPLLRTGIIEHGYALTFHRAQGITVDVALVYASQALTREAGYVGMSRGRLSNDLYTTLEALLPEVDHDLDHPADDPIGVEERDELTSAALVERLETSRAQRLGLSQMSEPAREAFGCDADWDWTDVADISDGRCR